MEISKEAFYYIYGIIETAKFWCSDDEDLKNILENVIRVLDNVKEENKDNKETNKSSKKLLNE